jgi:flagellar basal body-associated protein FliL
MAPGVTPETMVAQTSSQAPPAPKVNKRTIYYIVLGVLLVLLLVGLLVYGYMSNWF